MSRPDLILKSRRVFQEDNFLPAAVLISAGKISKIENYNFSMEDVSTKDFGDLALLPGLVDTHVHINEPGRSEWEGFSSATKAAAAGGITTLVDMPLNSIPSTVTRPALEEKRKTALNQCCVDVGFYGGLIPGHSAHLEELADAGVLGFKCFLIDSGVAEFPPVAESDLLEGLPLIARKNLPILAHCELLAGGESLPEATGDPARFSTFLNSRPPALEQNAIRLMGQLSQDFGAKVHVVHLSDSGSIEIIQAARQAGAILSVETCPHYLVFHAESIPDGDTRFKCTPPIREKSNSQKLWQGLITGAIDLVVSDHSPCAPELKRMEERNFMKAWGGIASLQFTLAATWTEASLQNIPASRLIPWFSHKPADFVGLTGRKGRIAPGYDADLAVWNSQALFTVSAASTFHRHGISPYEGRRLQGVVEATYLRGQLIYSAGKHLLENKGQLLER